MINILNYSGAAAATLVVLLIFLVIDKTEPKEEPERVPRRKLMVRYGIPTIILVGVIAFGAYQSFVLRTENYLYLMFWSVALLLADLIVIPGLKRVF